MTPRVFVSKYWSHALKAQATTKVPALVTMAQAALETGWGSTVVGNMMFGVKDSDGINGNEQLLTTTEYFNNPDKKFPVIISITKISAKLWKYRIKDWFRKYNSPEESFADHGRLLAKSRHYVEAMQNTGDPYKFATLIAPKYATDPQYASKLHKLMKMIESLI